MQALCSMTRMLTLSRVRLLCSLRAYQTRKTLVKQLSSMADHVSTNLHRQSKLSTSNRTLCPLTPVPSILSPHRKLHADPQKRPAGDPPASKALDTAGSKKPRKNIHCSILYFEEHHRN
ncbi:unnamed protein product [Durusdinium trenchii]|uniref:Uncharacterized protein n=1 Tax=Durusdinium trenchii TaxID=1381693 RepID=A0ABP0M9P9_9DINO